MSETASTGDAGRGRPASILLVRVKMATLHLTGDLNRFCWK